MKPPTLLWQNRFNTDICDHGIMRKVPITLTTPKNQRYHIGRLIPTDALNEASEACQATHRLRACTLNGGSALTLALQGDREAKEYRLQVDKREKIEVETDSLYHAPVTTDGFTSRQSFVPTLLLSQTTSLAPISQTSTDSQPHQSHGEGITLQTFRPQEDSPARRSEHEIELNDMSLRQIEEPPPPTEAPENISTQRFGARSHRSLLLLVVSGIALFLAPVNIVSGMTASNGDNWKLIFIGLFISWLLAVMTCLFLDLHRLQSSAFIKRCLWHVGGCVVSIYFFMSMLRIPSENLPQWLPTIIECGIAMSLGFQNIPVGESITRVISSIFGRTPVMLHRNGPQYLHTDEHSLSRTRRMDIETGSMVQSARGFEERSLGRYC